MDAPPIQYCTTKDGVSIAFWTLGGGPPLIYMPPLPAHGQLDWELDRFQRLYEWLGRSRTLVRFDGRNCGLSQRSVEDNTLETRALDLEAVAERLHLDVFDLIGHGASGTVAIKWAATRPETLRRLVLVDAATVALPGVETAPAARALADVLTYDFETFTEMVAGLVWGWAAGEETRQYAAHLRKSCSWEDWRRAPLAPQADYPELLSQISSPTLVVHHRDAIVTTIETGRRLASLIPNARLVALEGRAVAESYTDPQMMSAIDAFLAEGEQTAAPPVEALPHGTAVILFADIVDSTAMTERLGDAAFRAKARDLDAALRTVIRDHAGTPIEGKLLGDGVLATFASARQAIGAARACGKAGEEAGLPLHLGLHAGDVIREENNVFGGAINIAARISGLSAPGEVLVSETVRSLARTSAGVRFEDRGEQALKGVGEAVRVWAVREQSSKGKEQG